jgi:peptide/nickel transport system substrate-binding protein
MIDPLFNGKNIVPVNNVNYAQVDDPKLNAEMNKAETIIDPGQRAKAWGELDKEITKGAYVVTWLWDNQVYLASKNVNGVKNEFNSNWDLTASSLK